jgi:hypothetical protein
MRFAHALWCLTASAGAALAAPPALAVECDSDIDGNMVVDVLDLLEVLGQWGPCVGCPADINGDDVVDGLDLLQVLGDWGPCLFDYGDPWPDAEAEQIGLEMLGAGGPLLIPQAIYDRIDADLDLIRADHPGLVGETHSPWWVPNQLIVNLVPGEPLDDYQALNTYFQVIDEDNIFGDWWVLTFIGNINVPALAIEYMALSAVNIAEPNGIIGGQNFWTPSDQGGGVWRWDIDDGFWDCFDGCDCHRLYVIDTDADGTVTLISYQEVGQPWCEF